MNTLQHIIRKSCKEEHMAMHTHLILATKIKMIACQSQCSFGCLTIPYNTPNKKHIATVMYSIIYNIDKK